MEEKEILQEIHNLNNKILDSCKEKDFIDSVPLCIEVVGRTINTIFKLYPEFGEADITITDNGTIILEWEKEYGGVYLEIGKDNYCALFHDKKCYRQELAIAEKFNDNSYDLIKTKWQKLIDLSM